jgi:hypothetical protein
MFITGSACPEWLSISAQGNKTAENAWLVKARNAITTIKKPKRLWSTNIYSSVKRFKDTGFSLMFQAGYISNVIRPRRS